MASTSDDGGEVLLFPDGPLAEEALCRPARVLPLLRLLVALPPPAPTLPEVTKRREKREEARILR